MGESEVAVRVSEIYASIQGEGPRTGMGTLFLRFGGCNLRCPGWPCDTIFAIDPANRDEWQKRSATQVLTTCLGKCRDMNIANVCLTGGEPFIQNNDALEHIVDGLLAADIGVEIFTNGQVEYPSWAFEKLNFIMDWKLPGSGNAADRELEIEDRQRRHLARLKHTDAVKFVIKHHGDFQHAIDVWYTVKDETDAEFWAGVVWGQEDFTEAHLVDLIQMEGLPWHLNVQTHKYLWPADARGV